MKKKIVIASVLKPVDDVRSFWKISQSIAKTNKYEVNIIGNDTKNEIQFPSIKFHPHSVTRSQWLNRYLIRYKILLKTLKQKPSLLIVTDHELLAVAFIIKLLSRSKIVYDVQEDHYKNLLHLESNLLKKSYAKLVRFKELLSRLYISQYWLAEKCYKQEIGFVKSKNLVVENKAYKSELLKAAIDQNQLLFSGTISSYTGIDLVLETYKELIKIRPELKLQIIGQVHQQKLKIELEKQAALHKGIELDISGNAIPHESIIKAIHSSSFGIISYQANAVNKNKIPTKLYEYSRYRLPYLVQANTRWSDVSDQLGGSIAIDFQSIKAHEILKMMDQAVVETSNEYPVTATWEYESKKAISSIENLLKRH